MIDTQGMRKSTKGLFSNILLLLTVCILILTGCGREVETPVYDDEPEPVAEEAVFAIVSNLDEVNGKLVLRAVNNETEYVLSYTAGADVRDKFGEVMPMAQVSLGSLVDVTYDANRDKLLSLQVSDNASIEQLKEVSGAEFDIQKNTLTIQGKTYQMGNNVCAFSDNREIALNEIVSEDQLSIWLYNEKVCSIYVELGHGYVRLKDYASYLGGMVEIGYDVIVPVTEDMLLTVREGTYTLRISKDGDTGTKQVQVIKNQEMELSLADIAIEPKQMGSVLFQVTPSDAAVYVDGRRLNTEGAVDIPYGKHKLFITADGYETYSASFNVNYAYKIKKYSLEKSDAEGDSQETTAGTEATTVTETTTETTTESNTNNSNVVDVNTTTGTKTANTVTLSAPAGVSVYFDGEYIGIAPITFTKVTGSHIITLSQLGFLSKSYTVTYVDDGKDETLTYDALESIASLIE